ncbi:LamG domain-containing protein [Verrucomicrobiaceae bacterium N1E253]|uniref:LamG domain-containing protein n=1 Tax=Oceaniferula marina TaxID=2748318 RepID=A0A851GMA0_9BACT|nr:LamG domain-containing protein [Oceaniferula marina]NWK55254.1 LamG domain-containing protein [Oceaniferula marina]
MNKKNHILALLALVQDGEATPVQVSELKEVLREDASLLELARTQNQMHARLSVILEDEVSSERRVQGILDSLKDAETNQFVDRVGRRLSLLRWRKWAMTAAALVMIGLVSGIYFYQHRSAQHRSDQSVMATLQRAIGVQWSGAAIGNGSVLTAGASVEIEKGLLEFELAGRGRLIVEGPAQLNFPEDGRAILHQGRVVMRATEKGRGYRIETPQGKIIDISTEFGVAVLSNGLVETHVIEGSIEAISNDGKRVTLTRNDAMEMGPDGGKLIAADAGQFYTLMPPPSESKPEFIHWSFNEAEGNIAHSRGELAATIANKADMIFHKMGQGALPSRVPGPTPEAGNALRFDGKGSYAESGYRGIGGGKPRTVCFWLKVPEDFSVRQGFGIVSWGKHPLPGEVWQLSVNPLAKDGPIGRLRLGLEGGQIIGSSDLRDGKWHHIGVVMYGGGQPNVGTHVILYIDGELERLSRRSLQEVRTEIDQATHGVWLGRNVVYLKDRPHPHGGFFRGEIDDLYIFDASLSQSELLQLMEGN